VKLLLSALFAQDAPDGMGFPLLRAIVRQGVMNGGDGGQQLPQLIDLLLELGADVKEIAAGCGDQEGITPLHEVWSTAAQPHSLTAAQQHSRTAAQQHSRSTAVQQHSSTAAQ
jgi:hypothetical protein